MINNAIVLKHTHASFIFPFLSLQIDHCRAHMERAGPLATVWHFSAADRWQTVVSHVVFFFQVNSSAARSLRWWSHWRRDCAALGPRLTCGNCLQDSSLSVSRCLWKVWRALWLFCGETTSRTHACDESSEVTITTVGHSSCRTGLVQTPSYYIYIVPPTEKPETEEETSNTYVE